MGKITSSKQDLILSEFKNDSFLRSHFYFTGGTALSEYYLQHRISEDLDFFSEKTFNPQIILNSLNKWSKKHNFEIKSKNIENLTYVFNLKFPNEEVIKVDFAHYPYSRIEKSKIIDGIEVDSLHDIAINKLLSLVKRTEVKDFVDLYFLLPKYTTWDLIKGVEVKFRMEIDYFLLASDFLKIEQFDFLPKMILPLKLSDLKIFFKEWAKTVASRNVE